MENKPIKQDFISSSETFPCGTKSLKWIKCVIDAIRVLHQKRGIQEMNVYQMIVLILGVVALLMLEYSYGIRLSFVLAVTGMTVVALLALMKIGKK